MNKKIISFCVMGVAILSLVGCSAKKGGGLVSGKSSKAKEMGDQVISLGNLETIHFEFDASTITDRAARILQQNVDVINANHKMKVLVEGHCDERGSNEYNIALGERRAKASIDYMVSLGVSRNRLTMKSWGEERPLDKGQAPESYTQNRRAEFLILSK